MRIKSVAIATVIAGTAFVSSAGLANAGLEECKGTQLCMWGNNNFKWLIAARSHNNNTIVNLPGNVNDEMESWQNRSPLYHGCMFEDADGAGDRQQAHKASKDNDVNFFNGNEVTSYRHRTGC